VKDTLSHLKSRLRPPFKLFAHITIGVIFAKVMANLAALRKILQLAMTTTPVQMTHVRFLFPPMLDANTLILFAMITTNVPRIRATPLLGASSLPSHVTITTLARSTHALLRPVVVTLSWLVLVTRVTLLGVILLLGATKPPKLAMIATLAQLIAVTPPLVAHMPPLPAMITTPAQQILAANKLDVSTPLLHAMTTTIAHLTLA